MSGPMSRFSPEDRAALFDARVAAIHAGLHLTPDQEKLWPAVESAARDGMKTVLDLHEKFRAAGGTPNIIDRLQRASEMLIARGQSMKKVADAARPLYASLTDEQKHRLPLLMQAGHRGWREHAGMDARQRDRASSMEGNRVGSNGSQDRARGSDDHDRYDRSNRGYDSDRGQDRRGGADEDRDFDRRARGYDHGWYHGRRGGYDDRDFDRRDQGYDSGWRRRKGPDDDRDFDQRDRGWDETDLKIHEVAAGAFSRPVAFPRCWST